ncbi:GAF domain-containing protein [Williamsia phyllosphaerae]|uniref:GAF domain-containing protein n=1 Tax=Williamsia phyllosphaerae TaxID=885042 RepID=UPI00166746ED|nr:GAF domain-containing protein [Williamsia phyllosphaerae]
MTDEQSRVAIADLASTLTGDFDLPVVMQTVARYAREGLTAYSATVVLVDPYVLGAPSRAAHIVAESVADRREADQMLNSTGPGLESALGGATTMMAEIADDTRWPAYRERAALLGMRSVRAYPINALSVVLGSVVIHTSEPWGVGRPNGLGQLLADLTALALTVGTARERRDHASTAVGRVLEGSASMAFAIGIIAAARGIDPDAARQELTRLARAHDVTTTEHATAIVAGHDSAPGDPTAGGTLIPPAVPDPPRYFTS